MNETFKMRKSCDLEPIEKSIMAVLDVTTSL
jgi:hypothetical protein